MKQRTFVVLLAMLLTAVHFAAAQETAPRTSAPDGSQYTLAQYIGGYTRPLFLTHAGDGSNRLFVVEQGGHIYILEGGQQLPTPFLDVSALVSTSANERGLLGLAFHPDYATNGTFFINYTDLNGDTNVVRYRVSSDPNVADPNSAQVILHIAQPYENHNGGDIAFGADGYLYIGMGDGGSAGDPERNGQNPASLLGKILRLDVNAPQPYGIPADNPVATNPDLAPEIWALGIRNPWRFSFDRLTGDLYIGDVGQNQWEEVNFQAAGTEGGVNYGWNIMEATHRYSGEPVIKGLTDPITEYSHAEGCSITGGYVYRGAALPDLQGVYFFGDYCTGTIWSTYRDGSGAWQTNRFLESGQIISSFGEDESGELYVVNHGGNIWKLIAR